MTFRELIYSKQFFGSGGSGKLEEITITENGMYKPVTGVVPGGTYKFKDHYTIEELEKLCNGGDKQYYFTDRENNVQLYAFCVDGDYRLLCWAVNDYSWSHLYITENEIGYDYPHAGWYSLSGGIYIPMETPSVTLPTDTSLYMTDISALEPMFDLVKADGFNKVIVDVPAGGELTELTVTKNGTYQPVKDIVPGGTYRFKESYTNEELIELSNKSFWFIEDWDNNVGLYVGSDGSGPFICYYAIRDYSWTCIYRVDQGWFGKNNEAIEAPEIIFPENMDVVQVDLECFKAIFDVVPGDGFSKVIVDVPAGGELVELTVNENGIYEPLKEVVIGGTYKFKDHYTKEDFEAIMNGSTWFGFISDYENDVGLYITSYDSGYRLHYYAQGTYSWGYSYITEEATDSTYPTSGWFSSMGNAESVPAPTITMPDTTSGYQVELSQMEPLFDMAQVDGYNKVIVDVEPNLANIIVGENGIYEAVSDIELGKTYTFKNSYTDEELKMLFESGSINGTASIFIEDYDNNTALIIADIGNGLYGLQYGLLTDRSWGFIYVTPSVAAMMGLSGNGWLYASILENADTPTITIPTDASTLRVEPSSLAPFFGITLCDGYNKIIVDIPFAELTVTENGVYETASSMKLGGTYKFKDSYTDAELEYLFGRGLLDYNQSYLIAKYEESAFSIAKESYNGVKRYGIYSNKAIYVGEKASESYTNGIPGWYTWDKEPCDAPIITLPTHESSLYASFSTLESIFVLLNGYNKVVVDVQATATPTLEELVVTDNGEYIPDGIDGYNKVVVEVEKGVFPEGELKIKQNGVHDVTSYASVSIDVPIDGGKLASVTDTSVTEITVEDLAGATKIRNYAFYHCEKLTSVTIPDSVTSIGSSAFEYCVSLKNVIIPDSVTIIGNSAFDDCKGLTSVTIPNNVTSIEDGTFYNCSNLTNITIPNNVISIGIQAFTNCYNLDSVTIGSGVTSIGRDAFLGCGLTSVYITDIAKWCQIDFESINANGYSNPLVQAESLYLNGELVTDLLIPDDATTIKAHAFHGCDSLTSVTIPDSVTKIGGSAFGGCRSLTSVTIGCGVTSIGARAFTGDVKLEYIDLTSYGTDKAFPALYNTDAFDYCSTDTANGTFEIRVPAGRKAELAAMSNWSTYADNIVEV